MLTMGVIIQNLFVWGFLKFVWWRASKQYFYHGDYCSSAILRSDMDPLQHARASFKTLMWVRYSNNIIAFLTAGLRFKTSISLLRFQ